MDVSAKEVPMKMTKHGARRLARGGGIKRVDGVAYGDIVSGSGSSASGSSSAGTDTKIDVSWALHQLSSTSIACLRSARYQSSA